MTPGAQKFPGLLRRILRDLAELIIRSVFWSTTSITLQARILAAASLLAPRHPAVKRADRIVVIKLDRIGDFVMVTPFLLELRRNRPTAWITLVTSEIALPLARCCPHVDSVIPAPRAGLGLLGLIRLWRAWLAFAWHHLVPLRPTLAIIPRWDIDLYRAFPLLRLSNATQRVSFSANVESTKRAKNHGADRYLTNAVLSTPAVHEVQKNLDLLRRVGLDAQDRDAELWLEADGVAIRAQWLPGHQERLLVALCPFSAEEVKDWPFERFLAVVEAFRGNQEVLFVLLAGPEYEAASRRPEALALSNLVSLAGRLTLDETGALLTQCDLVLSVDTGLMHMAAALHRPMVVVHMLALDHEPTSHYSALRYGPWHADVTFVAPEKPVTCARRIDAVPVDRVVAAVAHRLMAA